MTKPIRRRTVSRLLIAALVLLGGPVKAVDYVQYREMLRTKTELLADAAKLQGSWWARMTKPACEHLQGQSYEVIGDCYDKVVDQYISKNYRDAVFIEDIGSTTLRRGLLFEPNAKTLGIAARKVDNDMAKAGCPIR